MPRPRKNPDFVAAFVDQLAAAIAARMGGGKRSAAAGKASKQRNFSKAGIERIRAAAKKRWAKWRKAKAAAAK